MTAYKPLDEVEYNDEGELERFCNTWEVSLESYVPEPSGDVKIEK